jgi:hypothetical protein
VGGWVGGGGVCVWVCYLVFQLLRRRFCFICFSFSLSLHTLQLKKIEDSKKVQELESILAEVATVIPAGAQESSKYALKRSCMGQFDPYFSRYTDEDRQRAEQAYMDAVKPNDPQCKLPLTERMYPPVSPDARTWSMPAAFAQLPHLLASRVLAFVIFHVLAQATQTLGSLTDLPDLNQSQDDPMTETGASASSSAAAAAAVAAVPVSGRARKLKLLEERKAKRRGDDAPAHIQGQPVIATSTRWSERMVDAALRLITIGVNALVIHADRDSVSARQAHDDFLNNLLQEYSLSDGSGDKMSLLQVLCAMHWLGSTQNRRNVGSASSSSAVAPDGVTMIVTSSRLATVQFCVLSLVEQNPLVADRVRGLTQTMTQTGQDSALIHAAAARKAKAQAARARAVAQIEDMQRRFAARHGIDLSVPALTRTPSSQSSASSSSSSTSSSAAALSSTLSTASSSTVLRDLPTLDMQCVICSSSQDSHTMGTCRWSFFPPPSVDTVLID